MNFQHSADIWTRFPALVPMVFRVDGVRPQANVDIAFERLLDQARARLALGAEGDWPAIQAWRRGFTTMGLKPTQYRCAAEALLRRLRKEGTLPRLHPLVDLCNAVSVAWAVPIAVLDIQGIDGDLTVRAATGLEQHLDFNGSQEQPPAGEVVFADAGNFTHARRWCHRQSARSVIQAQTSSALVVLEALHDNAEVDVRAAVGELVAQLGQAGLQCTAVKRLRPDDRIFQFQPSQSL